jgi:hypothetical protein
VDKVCVGEMTGGETSRGANASVEIRADTAVANTKAL